MRLSRPVGSPGFGSGAVVQLRHAVIDASTWSAEHEEVARLEVDVDER